MQKINIVTGLIFKIVTIKTFLNSSPIGLFQLQSQSFDWIKTFNMLLNIGEKVKRLLGNFLLYSMCL
jgi:hypothetical protein